MPPGIVCSYIKTAQRFARVAPMVAIDTALWSWWESLFQCV
jgi:hypothetical protein